ncbi:MAG: hypothetical protein WCV90_08095 [Candidatus Woesearchaeota archaeon]
MYNRKDLLNELTCEEICALQGVGSLKNSREAREIKFNKECYCQ